MRTTHIEEDVLEKYVMRALPAASIADVEEHLLACLLCQNRLVEVDEFIAVFRTAIAQLDARPAPEARCISSPRRVLWAIAAAVVAVLLVFLISGQRQYNRQAPSILLVQTLRGPEVAARLRAGKPYVLIFDVAVESAGVDYEIEIVDGVGKEILRQRAEVRDGRLTGFIGGLAHNSYWVRVYRRRFDSQLVAEYGLRSD